MTKKLLSTQMAELTASAHFRKCISEMKRLQRTFSDKNFVYISKPNDYTLKLLKDEGFKLEQMPIKEYVQYKVSW